VVEELNMAWMAVEASRGLERPRSLVIWHDEGVDLPAWRSAVAQELEVECRTLPEGAVAVRGAIARSQHPDPFTLAPPAWEEEHVQRLRRKNLLRQVGWAAAVWLVALCGLVLWVRGKTSKLDALEAGNLDRAPEVARVQELGEQVRSLSKFIDRSSSALEVLWLLAAAVPGSGGLEVEDLRYRKEEGVVFSGSVYGQESLFLNFVENLGGSDLLRVEDYNLTRDRDGDQRFKVETRWRWLPASSEQNG
jgi:hypothetical protein